MPRIPYVYPAPGENEIADQIRERRGEQGLIPIDGMFLNAPALANGYSALLSAVRNQSSLPGDLRELIILRVAALAGVAFEWYFALKLNMIQSRLSLLRRAHEPIGRKEGLTTDHLRLIRDVSSAGIYTATARSSVLSPVQAAVMDVTDHSTRNVKIPQESFDKLKEHLDNQKITEVVGTIAAYNLVSRFLVGLDVADMADVEVPMPQDP